MKRLHDQKIEPAQRSTYSDYLISEIFTIWLPLLYFRADINELKLTKVCLHNVNVLINSAKEVLTNATVREILAQKLEYQGAQVKMLTQFERDPSGRSFSEERIVIGLYQKAVEMLPHRKYEKAKN